MRRPAGHLRPALSLKPSPTLSKPQPGLWLSRGCRCEFRQARSRAPLPDSVLAVGGATEGVWQGGSVMSTLRRWPCRVSRHDRGRRKTPRDSRCDRAETLAEPGIPSTAAGILLRHHRNPLPGLAQGRPTGSCSSGAARAETLSDCQEDLRRPPKKTPVVTPKKILRNSEQFPRTPRPSATPKTVITPEKTSAIPKKSQKTMKIWLKEQKMFFWPYHRGGGVFLYFCSHG